MERLTCYFPGISPKTIGQLERARDLFLEWNQRVNLISRKDSENLTERHILHSLSIALYYHFMPGTRVIDIGTGGGFPGIPLAIYFPEVQFTLVDSVSKNQGRAGNYRPAEAEKRELPGCPGRNTGQNLRFHNQPGCNGIPRFVKLFRHLLAPGEQEGTAHGILYLKGGDLEAELGRYYAKARIHELNEKLEETWFRTKNSFTCLTIVL